MHRSRVKIVACNWQVNQRKIIIVLNTGGGLITNDGKSVYWKMVTLVASNFICNWQYFQPSFGIWAMQTYYNWVEHKVIIDGFMLVRALIHPAAQTGTHSLFWFMRWVICHSYSLGSPRGSGLQIISSGWCNEQPSALGTTELRAAALQSLFPSPAFCSSAARCTGPGLQMSTRTERLFSGRGTSRPRTPPTHPLLLCSPSRLRG